jgi:hypothetical protein
MAQKNLVSFADAAGSVIADDAASSASVVMRDGSGDIYGAAIRGSAGVVSSGRWHTGIVTKTGTYTATAADCTILCDATSAAFTVTLPPANTVSGRIYHVLKIDSSANAVTVDGDGSETINGATTKALASQWDKTVIQSNGTAWYIIS